LDVAEREECARVFENKALQVAQLLLIIRDEGRQWVLAGYNSLLDFFT
jgi:hypothetical protein